MNPDAAHTNVFRAVIDIGRQRSSNGVICVRDLHGGNEGNCVKLKTASVLCALAVLAAVGVYDFQNHHSDTNREPIKVGVLHSLVGLMAKSEKPVVDATLLAIEEINAAGGILGRDVEVVIADGRSNPSVFKTEAERLISEEGVSAIFGCWTSACRKTIKPIIETHNNLLFYPLQYEGLEQSPNIVYTGAAPNQQIIPAVKWAMDRLGSRFYLVGSDYIFPRVAHAVIRDVLATSDTKVVGESYIRLGSRDVDDVVADIVKSKPDVILNTINGATNFAFFAALRKAGILSSQVPTMSFSIGESELQAQNSQQNVGDYASWTYFQSIDSRQNQHFVEAFRAKYGARRVISDPMEAAYSAVHLWAQAVQEAGTDSVDEVLTSLAKQTFAAPQGPIALDSDTQHLWKSVHIGKVREDGQFDTVWHTEGPVRPSPFPSSRSKEEWQALLDDLFEQWGGRWVAGETS